MSDLPLLFNPEPTMRLGGTIILQLISTFLVSLYFVTSVVGLFIGALNYHNVCKQNFQLLIILESTVSLPLALSGLYIIYRKRISCSGLGFWITGFVISCSLIMIGMFLLWGKNKEARECPDIVYVFSWIYFNLWWLLAGIGLLFMAIVWPVYRGYKLKIDV